MNHVFAATPSLAALSFLSNGFKLWLIYLFCVPLKLYPFYLALMSLLNIYMSIKGYKSKCLFFVSIAFCRSFKQILAHRCMFNLLVFLLRSYGPLHFHNLLVLGSIYLECKLLWRQLSIVYWEIFKQSKHRLDNKISSSFNDCKIIQI